MKLRRREEGYTLITVLLIFTVVTIIAVTLMAASVSTFKFVKSSENKTKDKLNAEMVLDEATALIQNELDGINSTLSTGSILPNQLLTMMQNSLNRVAQEKKDQCNITYETLEDGSNADGVIMEKVTITVPVGDSGKVLKKVLTLSTVSDVFQYTAITPSNFYLYGAPYISGDVNVGGDIYSTNYSTYVNGWRDYAKTAYPAINGSLTVNGGYYYSDAEPERSFLFSNDPPEDMNWKSYNTSNIKNYFSVVPQLKNRNLSIDTIQVGNIINKNRLTWPSNQSADDLTVNKSLQKTENTYVDDLTINSSGNLEVKGNLYIKDDLYSKGMLKVDGNIYVGGDATISGNLNITGNGHYIYFANSNETVTLNNLNLDGVMYVNGSADLSDDVNTNGSIYVKKSINVQNLSNHDGTLVLLCDGDIQLSNNNLYNDKPKVIDAYFYSNSELFIYGVGSNLKINGGIYGNPIILSALKGSTSEDWLGNIIYDRDHQQSIDPTKSRLSIYFKKDLILNAPNGIPTVDKVTLKEIDTSFDDK